ncbi:MAG: hypothetical protein LN414_03920, partial [Candidatus Thermoplasmatota archaeon]|nr:hypothetical protein [Candidatus Thermoplasmatota archaeon]
MTIIAALAMLTPGAEAAPTIDGTVDTGEYDLMVKLDSDRYEIHWTYDGADIYVAIRGQTTGWIAIGFDPSDRMKDADMVYGWVDSVGGLTIFDLYAIGVNGPHPEDTQQGGTYDLLDAAGTEDSGWTTLEFTRKVNTGDTYDNVIPTTGTIPIIWAVGPSDSFTAQHIRR